jgi:hypothetical protein
MVLIKQRGMNMISDVREVTDTELDVVAGGMNCSSAMVLARINLAAARVAGALGDSVGQGFYLGQAAGLLQGGCL